MSEAMPTEHKRCAATRKNGQPCNARALPDSQYCFSHDPGRKEQRDAARRKGGHNSAKVVRLQRLMPPRLIPIFDRIEQALEQTHEGTLEPAQANALANLSRALVTLLQAGEFEARLRSLEETAERNESSVS